MIVLEIIVAILLIAGCFFAVTAGVGMLRMPDFYTRVHPAGKADTLGQMLVLGALIVMVLIGPPQTHHQDGADTKADPAIGDRHSAQSTAAAHDTAPAPDWPTAMKLVLIVVFLVITCPTATHAITRAAHLAGLNPWMNDESRANEANANAAALARSEGTDVRAKPGGEPAAESAGAASDPPGDKPTAPAPPATPEPEPEAGDTNDSAGGEPS